MEIYLSIENPIDQHTYIVYPNGIHNLSKIEIENIGGSQEKCTYENKNGVLKITTPVFAVNPKRLKIVYDTSIPISTYTIAKNVNI